MFDSVGKNLDQDANKRLAQSSALVLLCVALVTGFVMGAGLFVATKTILDDGLDDEEIVMVEMADPEMADAPPPPPPPPPPPAAAEEEEEEEEEEDEEPEPDDMQEEVKELEEEVKKEIKSQDRPKGQEGGVEGGREGGVAGGVIGGVDGGVLGGQLGGVRTFHHSEVEPKRRVYPKYPDAAQAMNLGDVTCRVRVFIDETGTPYDTNIEGCPKVFHADTHEAILKWRWYPAKFEGKKVKAQFVIVVKYNQK